MTTAARPAIGRRSAAALLGLLAGAALAGAAVTFQFDGQTLSITASGNAGENITVAVASGQVTVNGTPAAPANAVVSIEILGTPADDTIDLVTIDPGDLPLLTAVTIDGGGGADQIFGSQGNDTIIDEDGGDDWIDQGGDDTYIISPTGGNLGPTELSGAGAGSDTLSIEGTSGDDVFKVSAGQVSLGARSVTIGIAQLDAISLMGNGGDDTFVVAPLDNTPVGIDGGAGNDHLAIDNQGLSATQSSGQISLTGKAPVRFSGVENVTNCDFATLASTDNDGDGVPDECDVNPNAGDGVGGAGGDDAGGDDNGGQNGPADGGQDGLGGGDSVGDNSPGSGDAGPGAGGDAPGDDADGTDMPADALLPAACGAGLCGFGLVPAMPLMLAGLGGFKWRLRRGRP